MIGRVIEWSLVEGGDCCYLNKHTMSYDIRIGNQSTIERIKEAEKILEPF